MVYVTGEMVLSANSGHTFASSARQIADFSAMARPETRAGDGQVARMNMAKINLCQFAAAKIDDHQPAAMRPRDLDGGAANAADAALY